MLTSGVPDSADVAVLQGDLSSMRLSVLRGGSSCVRPTTRLIAVIPLWGIDFARCVSCLWSG